MDRRSVVPTLASFDIADYHEVLALWKRCEGVGLSDADEKEAIAAYLLRNPRMSFIARVSGVVVGAILCGHDGRRGYIHHLAVESSWRRRGLAQKLVEKSLDELQAYGIGKAHVFIFNDNAQGIAFWRATGWERRFDISVISKTI